MEFTLPTTTESSMGSPATTIGGYEASISMPRSRKRRTAIGDVTPQPKKRKQLSADKFHQRGKLEETWRKYIGHWRRFYKWLETSPHKDLCMDGHNLNTADVFKSMFMPVPLDIFDEYIAFYSHKDDHMLKAKSTLDSFWAALVRQSWASHRCRRWP